MGAQGRISDGAPVTRARGRRAHARGGQRRAGGSGETPEEQTTFRRKRVVRTRRILVHVVFLPGVGFSYAESGAQVDQTPAARNARPPACVLRSEEHTSELQSLMRISYAVFCLKKKKI